MTAWIQEILGLLKNYQGAGAGEAHGLNTPGNKYEDPSSDLQNPMNAGWVGGMMACL